MPFDLSIDISDATKWSLLHSADYTASPDPVFYNGRYLDHTPIPDSDLNFIFDNHLIRVDAVLNQQKNWRGLGQLSAYVRTTGTDWDAKVYSRSLSFGKQLLIIPRIGGDFKLRIERIKPWISAFTLNVYQYELEPVAIEEAKLLALESSLVEMSAVLESIENAVSP